MAGKGTYPAGPGEPESARDALTRALERQRTSCENLGSPLYARMIDALLDDHGRDGVTSELLAHGGPRPLHDAVVLRLLAGLHRRVLHGEAEHLARHYPSAGGRPGPGLEKDLLATMVLHRDRLAVEMAMPVQTNEPGRAVAAMAVLVHPLLAGSQTVTWREIGASAGLNLNFTRFAYEAADGILGDPDSPLVFPRQWSATPGSAESVSPRVVDARGCDPAPVDVTDRAGRIHLVSYVWPDDAERHRRLRAALAVAEHHPPVVDETPVAEWIGHQQGEPGSDLVFFHSIVWQYLDAENRDAVRRHVETLGRRTGTDAVGWARMEPAGERADLRLDLWREGRCDQVVLGTLGYHGQGFVAADETPERTEDPPRR